MDSGAKVGYLDDEPIPGLTDRMLNLIKLDMTKRITTSGGRVAGNGTRSFFAALDEGVQHAVKLFSVIVSGLERNSFSSIVAFNKGVKTTIKGGKHRLTKGNVTLPLEQSPGDTRLCSIDLRLGEARSAPKATSSGMVMAVEQKR